METRCEEADALRDDLKTLVSGAEEVDGSDDAESEDYVDVWEQEDLSYETFLENYLSARRPVVIRGVCKPWPAFQEWTERPDSASDVLVPATLGSALAPELSSSASSSATASPRVSACATLHDTLLRRALERTRQLRRRLRRGRRSRSSACQLPRDSRGPLSQTEGVESPLRSEYAVSCASDAKGERQQPARLHPPPPSLCACCRCCDFSPLPSSAAVFGRPRFSSLASAFLGECRAARAPPSPAKERERNTTQKEAQEEGDASCAGRCIQREAPQNAGPARPASPEAPPRTRRDEAAKDGNDEIAENAAQKEREEEEEARRGSALSVPLVNCPSETGETTCSCACFRPPAGAQPSGGGAGSGGGGGARAAQGGRECKDDDEAREAGASPPPGLCMSVPFRAFLHYWQAKMQAEKDAEHQEAQNAEEDAAEKTSADAPCGAHGPCRGAQARAGARRPLPPFPRAAEAAPPPQSHSGDRLRSAEPRRASHLLLPSSGCLVAESVLSAEEREAAAELLRAPAPWYLKDWHFVTAERTQTRSEHAKESCAVSRRSTRRPVRSAPREGLNEARAETQNEASASRALHPQQRERQTEDVHGEGRAEALLRQREAREEASSDGESRGRAGSAAQASSGVAESGDGEGADAEATLYFCSKHYRVPAHFRDDWLLKCPIRAGEDYRFAYLGARGTYTPWHRDVLGTSSWSANLCGVKRWVFESTKRDSRPQPPSSPSSSPPFSAADLRDDEGRAPRDAEPPASRDPNAEACRQPVRPRCRACGGRHAARQRVSSSSKSHPPPAPLALASDSRASPRSPLLGCPRPRAALLQFPGECVFVPADLRHRVCNVTDCVAINHNWCDAANILRVAGALKEDLASVREFLIEDFGDARPILRSLSRGGARGPAGGRASGPREEGEALASLSQTAAAACAPLLRASSAAAPASFHGRSDSHAAPASGLSSPSDSGPPDRPVAAPLSAAEPPPSCAFCEICGGAPLEVYRRVGGRHEREAATSDPPLDRVPKLRPSTAAPAGAEAGRGDGPHEASCRVASEDGGRSRGATPAARLCSLQAEAATQTEPASECYPASACVCARVQGLWHAGESRERAGGEKTPLEGEELSRRATGAYAELVMCGERILSANCGVTFFDFFFFLLRVTRTLLIPRLSRHARAAHMRSETLETESSPSEPRRDGEAKTKFSLTACAFDVLGALRVALLLRALCREGYVALITRAQVEQRLRGGAGGNRGNASGRQRADSSKTAAAEEAKPLPAWLCGEAESFSFSSDTARANLALILRASLSPSGSGLECTDPGAEESVGAEKDGTGECRRQRLALEEYHAALQALLEAVLALDEALGAARGNSLREETVARLRRLLLADTDAAALCTEESVECTVQKDDSERARGEVAKTEKRNVDGTFGSPRAQAATAACASLSERRFDRRANGAAEPQARKGVCAEHDLALRSACGMESLPSRQLPSGAAVDRCEVTELLWRQACDIMKFSERWGITSLQP
ncbi:hypothetical protein BESB_061760 [Besnoitia besnoiti]|uniref:JmjC domain-containing protein n=1 Tax=Besnoitia besnoiti TaxID=94643 RepID=A0A2A9MBN4_BESBE|nr:hypothetical protein BESB_061760 [Besnoitia besnoiti]PFH35289.1 hypothetical protein BESB_061760 [Besnoitia besnoiti]